MNMHLIDWSIVAAVVVFIAATAWRVKRYSRSVADFLAANRCAGRYLLVVSVSAGSIGAGAFIAEFEKQFEAGFVPNWWDLMFLPMSLILAFSGWVVYRFRETRALTLSQFFEIRYSRRFRIFAGVLIFISGIINFGIFPALGARFFIYFCGLPQAIHPAGIAISTYPLLLIILLGMSLFLTLSGGQITVIVTDFIQGTFCNFMFLILIAFCLMTFNWSSIYNALAAAPRDASLLNPYQTSKIESFNIWFFLILMVSQVYQRMAWQGTSGFNAAPRNAHEAKMCWVLNPWKNLALVLVFTLLPVCAYVIMHDPAFSSKASQITGLLNGISANTNDTIRVQMTVPVVLSQILPAGLLGGFCAVILAAFISNHNTYLHSWGTIFIQDVVMPFRKKPFSPRDHLRLLRISIFAVAVFIFCFSLWFKQTQHILMFWALSGAIWSGGGGAVIIGGLYSKRGSTTAAYAALIAGCTLGFGGLLLEQVWNRYFDARFPVNGQWMLFIAMVSATVIYILISLLGRREKFNLDRMLHRGEYAVEEHGKKVVGARTWRDIIGFTGDIPRGDKVLYLMFLLYAGGWFLVFMFATVYNLIWGISDRAWGAFWHFFVWMSFSLGAVATVWLLIGGVSDLKYMFKTLSTAQRNELDDGMVGGEAKKDDEFQETAKSQTTT
jgi:SSS family solute:Na+ symporter